MDPRLLSDLRAPDGQALLREAADAMPAYSEAAALAVTGRLRTSASPDLVAAALTQVRLRERARGKFGDLAASLYFTADGLEQATAQAIASRRAARFAAAGIGRVADLCCGVGSDALALAAAGVRVLAVDRDPLVAGIAAANAEAAGVADLVEVRCADVRTMNRADLDGCEALFCDPARRDPGGRRLQPEAWSPPYSWLVELAGSFPATAAKVAPGLAHERIPPGVEAEWVSVAGDVKEACLWWGGLSTVRRRATLLPGGAELIAGNLGPPPVAAPGRYLYEPDGAVIRAGLVAEVAALLEGALLDATIAYVSSDRLVPTPYARAYEITDVLPFSLKALRTLLRARGVGVVTVKKRGSAVDPETLRRQLRLVGPASAVVVLTRVQGAPVTILAQPVPGC